MSKPTKVEVQDRRSSLTVTKQTKTVEVSSGRGPQGSGSSSIWYKPPYTYNPATGFHNVPFLDEDLWGSLPPNAFAADPDFDGHFAVTHGQASSKDVVDDPNSPIDGGFIGDAAFSFRFRTYNSDRELLTTPGGAPLGSRTVFDILAVAADQDGGPTPLYVTAYGNGAAVSNKSYASAFSDSETRFNSRGSAISGEDLIFSRGIPFQELQQRIYDSHQLGIDGGTY